VTLKMPQDRTRSVLGTAVKAYSLKVHRDCIAVSTLQAIPWSRNIVPTVHAEVLRQKKKKGDRRCWKIIIRTVYCFSCGLV
jgi:hypothetical protein